MIYPLCFRRQDISTGKERRLIFEKPREGAKEDPTAGMEAEIQDRSAQDSLERSERSKEAALARDIRELRQYREVLGEQYADQWTHHPLALQSRLHVLENQAKVVSNKIDVLAAAAQEQRNSDAEDERKLFGLDKYESNAPPSGSSYDTLAAHALPIAIRQRKSLEAIYGSKLDHAKQEYVIIQENIEKLQAYLAVAEYRRESSSPTLEAEAIIDQVKKQTGWEMTDPKYTVLEEMLYTHRSLIAIDRAITQLETEQNPQRQDPVSNDKVAKQ